MYTQISLFSQISLPAPVVVIMSMYSLLVHKDDVGGINFPVVNWPTFTSNSMFLSIICDLVSQPMSPSIGSCPLKLKLITELGLFNTGFYLACVLAAILCRYVTLTTHSSWWELNSQHSRASTNCALEERIGPSSANWGLSVAKPSRTRAVFTLTHLRLSCPFCSQWHYQKWHHKLKICQTSFEDILVVKGLIKGNTLDLVISNRPLSHKQKYAIKISYSFLF